MFGILVGCVIEVRDTRRAMLNTVMLCMYCIQGQVVLCSLAKFRQILTIIITIKMIVFASDVSSALLT